MWMGLHTATQSRNHNIYGVFRDPPGFGGIRRINLQFAVSRRGVPLEIDGSVYAYNNPVRRGAAVLPKSLRERNSAIGEFRTWRRRTFAIPVLFERAKSFEIRNACVPITLARLPGKERPRCDW